MTKKEEMGPAIREAIEGGKPALIDVWIDCDEKYSRWYRQELRLRMSSMQRIWQKRNKKRIDRFLTKRYHSFNVVKQYRITARIAQM